MSYIIVNNSEGKSGRINCCENFPTCVGDTFTIIFDGKCQSVTVMEISNEKVEIKKEKKEIVQQMSLF